MSMIDYGSWEIFMNIQQIDLAIYGQFEVNDI